MLLYIVLGVVAIPLLWSAISPRSLWSTIGRPQYKNPDAVEPSAANFALWRVVAIIALIGMVVFVWVLVAYRP
jgi:nicotinamide riboside transporter PnuC